MTSTLLRSDGYGNVEPNYPDDVQSANWVKRQEAKSVLEGKLEYVNVFEHESFVATVVQDKYGEAGALYVDAWIDPSSPRPVVVLSTTTGVRSEEPTAIPSVGSLTGAGLMKDPRPVETGSRAWKGRMTMGA